MLAEQAHRETGGLFDPRVLTVLRSTGYDRSLPFAERSLMLDALELPAPRRRWSRTKAWKPEFDEERSSVRIGSEPVDLGGIGKGLAVTWAAEILAGCGDAVLVEAGGDLMALGPGPDGDGWMVDVENPFGGQAAAVLRVTDRGIATSSTRIRSWTVGERQVHHLIDPRTRQPAESDLASVTVVGADPGTAEVWSKSLFVLGRSSIRVVRGRPRTRGTLGRHRRPRRCQSRDAPLRRLAGLPCRVSVSTPSTVRPISMLARSRWAPASSCSSRRAPSLTSWLVGTAVMRVAGDKMAPWILGRSAGITSYLLLVGLVLFGLVLSHPARARIAWPSSTTRIRAHVSLSVFTLVFTVLHIVVLATDKYAGVGWWGAFVPMGSTYRPMPVTLGVIGLYAGSRRGTHRRARRTARPPRVVAGAQGRDRLARPRVAARRPRRHRHPDAAGDVRRDGRAGRGTRGQPLHERPSARRG